MGRSSGNCFKIIACGGSSESVDRDDLDASSENKGTDKRGWSFRKKSAVHRVVNNTIITETPSSDDKKTSEPVIINSEPPITFPQSEKTSTNQHTEEFSRVSTSTTKDNSTPSILVTKDDDIKFDSSHDESSIIVIQAAVRKFLAQREYLRVKSVVKLQAVVRGHLVRCRAAGALRCIQAIVKMQALVRVRNSKISAKRFSLGEKGIQSSNTKPHPTYISIEKLLSNRFANQLIESTPRTKQINIKCDPSKQDQTWKWFERWMSVSSPQVKVEETETKSLTLTTGTQTGSTSPETTITEAEPLKRPPKRVATEEADSDGRKSVFGSKKASNPSFIAAQSKFAELTLTSKTTTEPAVQTIEPVVYESLKVGRTAGSECGTELSVTSMLDSPDPSESGTTKPKLLDTELTHSIEEHDLLGTELTHSISILPEPYNTTNQTEASPIQSEKTPSSNNTKRVPGEKPKSWSNSKKSPVSRGSLDNLPKPSGNRRNSFGSQSSEIEQEARDSHSSSSNYIPSYMQVTESARLKALNSSPRLSPDVQGKEAYTKKRHSMPGAVNGRHGSPRLKRSSPQNQQTTKGNDNRERKWQS